MAYASWHTTVTDLQGNVIPNASIYVVNEVTGIAPQLYSDRQGLVPMGNPFTAEADGTVNFYVIGGTYRIQASFGSWERTWRYVGIGTAQEYDVDQIIGDALDDVVTVNPQTLTPEQQEQARENIGIISLPKPTARVRRMWVDATRSYDVIEIKGQGAGFAINQVVNPEPGQPGVQRRIPVREFARVHDVPIATNSQAFRNADGSPGWDNELLVPNGLCIAQGQLVADWSSGTNATRNQAVVMFENGRLAPAYRETSTGAGLVAAGARFAVSWGAFCVLDGVGVSGLNSGYMGTASSARTVLGQRSNGEIVLVLFEGVTGVSGFQADETTPVMLALGCDIAFICDGGGSTQAWWNSYYAHGSSDLDFFRTLPASFVIDAVTENEYDSGPVVLEPPAWSTGPVQTPAPPLSIRQVGPNIYTRLNLAGFSAGGIITRIAPRYLPESPTEARGVLNGGGGYLSTVTMAGGANLGNFSVTKALGLTYPDPTSVVGTSSWLQRL